MVIRPILLSSAHSSSSDRSTFAHKCFERSRSLSKHQCRVCRIQFSFLFFFFLQRSKLKSRTEGLSHSRTCSTVPSNPNLTTSGGSPVGIQDIRRLEFQCQSNRSTLFFNRIYLFIYCHSKQASFLYR